ncbi:unnamed protein product [Brassicogethes aeneus]|uniref:Pyridoxal kinase n=1 Tax=Brassicogethes aeneus TaxID=1431903 RepID=A0A9P0FHS3_BRAAE|nr:unnamed protein product [Brassicogethes aeneus]
MEARVLSVQSHVVHGYVGNKSVVFPLQLLGFDVDAINSVQLSNHTGYKKFGGQVLTDKDLLQLINPLIENGLDSLYSHILSGYIGSASFLYEVTKLVKHLKTKNPDIVYVCDPVMGDNGKMYVPPELVTIYKEFVVPLATIITPNLFEAELLSEIKINEEKDVWEAVDILHSKGCPIVVISSAELGDRDHLQIFASQKGDYPVTNLLVLFTQPHLFHTFAAFSFISHHHSLTCLEPVQSETIEILGDSPKRVQMQIPKVPAHFTGTGDLFAGLFLAWMHKTQDMKESIEKTIASLQAVLKRTFEHGKEINVKNLELRLIQSKKDIEEPQVVYEAVPVA